MTRVLKTCRDTGSPGERGHLVKETKNGVLTFYLRGKIVECHKGTQQSFSIAVHKLDQVARDVEIC